MENIQLTKEEELAAAKLAGSWMGKLCIFGAKAFKGTGVVLEKSSKVTAAGLRAAANGVEYGGEKSSQYCYRKSDQLKAKAKEYDEDSARVSEAQGKLNKASQEMKEAQEKFDALMNEMKTQGMTPALGVK